MDAPTASLLGSVLLFVASLITLLLNRRESKARVKNQNTDTLSKLEDVINKVQERADKLYDEKIKLEIQNEKLRNDLAIALVEKTELKEELATKNGYIQGITNPLIKLEEKQRKELAGGRRSTDIR